MCKQHNPPSLYSQPRIISIFLLNILYIKTKTYSEKTNPVPTIEEPSLVNFDCVNNQQVFVDKVRAGGDEIYDWVEAGQQQVGGDLVGEHGDGEV